MRRDNMKKLFWAVGCAWEIVYKNVIRARFLKGSQQRLLRIAYRTYRGPGKTIDECPLQKGDLLAELHLSNPALQRYKNQRSPEWALYKDLIEELRLLSKIIKEDNIPIKALCGITLLAPAAVRLGFTAEEIRPGLWASLNYFWLRLLRIAFSPRKSSNFKPLDAGRRPFEIWISAERFLERF